MTTLKGSRKRRPVSGRGGSGRAHRRARGVSGDHKERPLRGRHAPREEEEKEENENENVCSLSEENGALTEGGRSRLGSDRLAFSALLSTLGH